MPLRHIGLCDISSMLRPTYEQRPEVLKEGHFQGITATVEFIGDYAVQARSIMYGNFLPLRFLVLTFLNFVTACLF